MRELKRREATALILSLPILCVGLSSAGTAVGHALYEQVRQQMITGGEVPYLFDNEFVQGQLQNWSLERLEDVTMEGDRFSEPMPRASFVPLADFAVAARGQAEVFGEPYETIARSADQYAAIISYPERQVVINRDYPLFIPKSAHREEDQSNVNHPFTRVEINQAITSILLHFNARLTGQLMKENKPLVIPGHESDSAYPRIFAHSGLTLFLKQADSSHLIADGFATGLAEIAASRVTDQVGIPVPIYNPITESNANLVRMVMDKLGLSLSELMRLSASPEAFSAFPQFLYEKYQKAYPQQKLPSPYKFNRRLAGSESFEPWATQVLFVPTYVKLGMLTSEEGQEIMKWLLSPSIDIRPRPNSEPVEALLEKSQNELARQLQINADVNGRYIKIPKVKSRLVGYLKRRFGSS